jgi:tRNA threonylcarbamoyladenosine biosynthesis protein TsaB
MLLAINTSALQYSVALMEEDGTILAEYQMAKGERHFGGLMPILDFLVRTSKSDIHDLKCIAIAMGPGRFTGLRVGLSAVKGLCHALEIPAIGVSSLEALASQIPYSDLPITPILDSRKGELFAAQFVWTGDLHLIRKMKDISLKFQDLASLIQKPSVFIGNDFAGQEPLIKKVLGPDAVIAASHFWNLRASAVGFLGLKRFHARDFDELRALNPVYLRPPDIRSNPFQHRFRSASDLDGTQEMGLQN